MIQKMNSRRGGFTLVEIMIVVAIIAMLASIAVPSFLRARKRSLATLLLNELRLVKQAKDQYAMDFNKTLCSPASGDLAGYMEVGGPMYNIMLTGSTATNFTDPKINNVTFYINTSDVLPSIDTHGGFSEVVDTTFWSPYTFN